MTAVLKSGRSQDRPVRALGAVLDAEGAADAHRPGSGRGKVIDAAAERVSQLENALAEAQAVAATRARELDRLAQAEQAAYERGLAEGRRLGAEAADARNAERLERLTQTGAAAVRALETGLAGLERVAAGLADVALSRVTEDADARRALVLATVRRAAARLFDSAGAVIEVSAEDFSEVPLLTAPGPGGAIALTVARRAELASGECRVRLALGELDLSLDRQLQRLRSELEAFGEARP